MAKDILLEIGVEEIPAGYLTDTAGQLSGICDYIFNDYRVGFRKICVYSTCRRLVVYAKDVSEKQLLGKKAISGPSEKVAFCDGKPTQVAAGFAGKHGVPVSELFIKDGRACLIKKEPTLNTEQVLPDIFTNIISRLTFPKTMVWEEKRFRFVRPIRWLLAMFGKKIVKFQIADVKSSNLTYLRNGKKIKITAPSKYLAALRNKSVIVEQAPRLEMVKKTVNATVRNTGSVLEGMETFNIVNNMVEFPSAVLCRFDEKYLKLSQELIIFTLKKQKNFVVIDDKKKLLPCFVGVKDGISTNLEVIGRGYEKVIAARLEDAEFYLKNDTGTPLEAKVERLKGIVFQEKLGTIYDKTVRIGKLASWLCEILSKDYQFDRRIVDRICFLCKADLVTRTVSEFPELQGIFGRICALQDKEDANVARGIEQHWWPVTYADNVPETLEASIVALSDKIDTLAGNFALGIIPTGSADPYGLRRMAFGIIKICLDQGIRFNLNEMLVKAVQGMPVEVKNSEKVVMLLKDFIRQRFETYPDLKAAKGILYDEIEAVVSPGFCDIVDSYRRVLAVHEIRKLPDFEPISASFKRIGNILRQAGRLTVDSWQLAVDEKLFKEQEEKELYEKFLLVRETTDRLMAENDYIKSLYELISLRKPIDNFFEKVLIMDKDDSVKNNRLTLLSLIHGQFKKIADFSKIVNEK